MFHPEFIKILGKISRYKLGPLFEIISIERPKQENVHLVHV
jgi:hypothetical protein